MDEKPRWRSHSYRRASAKWAACCLLLLVCCYRIARFVPQPLDSPHTLRPILNRWFVTFLDLFPSPPAAYSAWKQLCLIALIIPAVLVVLNYTHESRMFKLPSWTVTIFCSRTLLFVAIGAALFIGRFPSLLDYQLNPDEGEFLSAAHKLFYDGNFFHSVDCGTSGPVNIYPLMLPAIFGLSPDYASSRLIVAVMLFLLIYLVYRSFSLLTSDALSRIAILPLATALPVFHDANLVHYSSEETPLLLIGAAFYLAVRVLRRPTEYLMPLALLGVLASLAFFAKMQSVPIVVALALAAIAYTLATGNATKLWRPTLVFVAGTIPIFLLNAGLCLAAGVWRNFWMSYIVSNQRYVEMNSDFFTDLPVLSRYLVGTVEIQLFVFTFFGVALAYAAFRVRRNATREQTVYLQLLLLCAGLVAGCLILYSLQTAPAIRYVILLTIVAIPMYSLLVFRAGKFGIEPVRWLGLLSFLFIAAACFSIYKPHRTFPHYLLFLLTPLCAAMGWMLVRESRDAGSTRGQQSSEESYGFFGLTGNPVLVTLFVTLAVTSSVYVWGAYNDHSFRTVVPTIRPPEGDFIRSLTSPRGRIFVWGWTPDPYLGSGRVTATRDLNLFYVFIGPPEITKYYRARLLNDLIRNPPEVFVDAVGATSWSFTDRSRYNFEQFRDIAAFVDTNYDHFADAYEQRYFVRRDLAPNEGSAIVPKHCAPEALACMDRPSLALAGDAALVPTIKNLSAVEMPYHALIEVRFTPMAHQIANATVFSNEEVPNSQLGFRFQNIGGDWYRLILGLGDDGWAFSKAVSLLSGKAAAISIEIQGSDVYLKVNGTAFDDMHMRSAMADAPGEVTVGSWINGECPFTGQIRFFQIVDLSKPKATY